MMAPAAKRAAGAWRSRTADLALWRGSIGAGRAAGVDRRGREVLEGLPDHPRLDNGDNDAHGPPSAGAHVRIDLVDGGSQEGGSTRAGTAGADQMPP